MRPPSDFTLRLQRLPRDSRLIWTSPSADGDMPLTVLRRTLVRLGIPFAEQSLPDQPGRYHRLFWVLKGPQELRGVSALRADQLESEGSHEGFWDGDQRRYRNLRRVLPGDTAPTHKDVLDMAYPTPERSIDYGPLTGGSQLLEDTLRVMRPGQGVKVRLVNPPEGASPAEAASLLPATPDGFFAVYPDSLKPMVDFWRMAPRPAYRTGQGIFVALAATMGNGDSVLCPEGADRNYANTLCQALVRAGRPDPVQRSDANGRIRVWVTTGNPTPEHLDGSEFLVGGDVLVLEREVPIWRRAYTRKAKAPFESRYKAIEVGEHTDFDGPNAESDARALCMSMRRRGWIVRVGRHPSGKWYVVCEGERAIPPPTAPTAPLAKREPNPAPMPASNPEPPPPKRSEAPAPSPIPPTAAEPKIAAEVKREPEPRPAGRLPLPDVETDLRDGESREFDVGDKAAAQEFAARQMAKGICVEHRVVGPVEDLRRRVTRIDVNAGLDVIFEADDPVMLKASAAFAKKEAVREAARAARKEADHG